jgi:class 3 adenylate cyclase
VDAPEAQYVERDGAQLAYQVVGEGGVDVVVVGETAQHFDLCWTDPYIYEVYERGVSFSRTVYMQPRGFGLSERIRYVPTIEQHADDILAVMDAVGMRTATLVGVLTTSGLTALAAARAPERVANLVLFKPIACGPLAPNAAQHGWTTADAAEYTSRWQPALDRWGSGAVIEAYDAMQGSAYNRRLMAMLERCSATPATARQYWEWFVRLDVSEVLGAVRAPTRVLYAPTSPEPEAVVRRVAELIPQASLYHLPPTHAGAAIGEAWIAVWLHVEEAATGARRPPDADRFFGTMLFTDVVGSTELLARIGDAEYRALRATHERHVRLQVEHSGGRLINVTGDGTFSLFDGPTQAVRCAEEIRKSAEELGISVRAGVHAGELERTGRDLTGLSVHVGARVGAMAMPNEVLVSRTVRDLVAGSGLAFVDRGSHTLKGVPGRWHVYALAAADQPVVLPIERSLETPLDHVALRTARTAPRAVRAALRAGNALQRYRARGGTERV